LKLRAVVTVEGQVRNNKQLICRYDRPLQRGTSAHQDDVQDSGLDDSVVSG